uniref:Pyroglutamyl-peptidase I n=1 Tax=Varanus komodoensis TaxID=61221 RepID=A0A8D2IXY4_VARKO
HQPPRKHQLPAGFGPFGEHSVNASWIAVQELEKMGLREDVDLHVYEIPVEYQAVQRLIPALWEKHSPQVSEPGARRGGTRRRRCPPSPCSSKQQVTCLSRHGAGGAPPSRREDGAAPKGVRSAPCRGPPRAARLKGPICSCYGELPSSSRHSTPNTWVAFF